MANADGEADFVSYITLHIRSDVCPDFWQVLYLVYTQRLCCVNRISIQSVLVPVWKVCTHASKSTFAHPLHIPWMDCITLATFNTPVWMCRPLGCASSHPTQYYQPSYFSSSFINQPALALLYSNYTGLNNIRYTRNLYRVVLQFFMQYTGILPQLHVFCMTHDVWCPMQWTDSNPTDSERVKELLNFYGPATFRLQPASDVSHVSSSKKKRSLSLRNIRLLVASVRSTLSWAYQIEMLPVRPLWHATRVSISSVPIVFRLQFPPGQALIISQRSSELFWASETRTLAVGRLLKKERDSSEKYRSTERA